jgi:hypothetical protein
VESKTKERDKLLKLYISNPTVLPARFLKSRAGGNSRLLPDMIELLDYLIVTKLCSKLGILSVPEDFVSISCCWSGDVLILRSSLHWGLLLPCF